MKCFLTVLALVVASFLYVESSQGMTFVDYEGQTLKSVVMTYERKANLLWLEAEDGTFSLQDFSKAVIISGRGEGKVCYVSPFELTPVKQVNRKQQQQRARRDMLEVIVSQAEYTTSESKLVDTSSLPAEAVRRCTEGFKQRLPVSEEQSQTRSSQMSDSCKCEMVCQAYPPSCVQQCDCKTDA